MDERAIQAFDSELFRRQGHAVVDLLADYLKRAAGKEAGGEAMPVLPALDPNELVKAWPDVFPELPAGEPVEALRGLLGRVLAGCNHLHHPHYVGHQVTAPLPQAAVTELFSALLNNAMAVYEMGPAATAMERSVLRWMGTQIGFSREKVDGVLTSGGSIGNLTALLAARQDRAGFDAWTLGHEGGPPLSILVSESAHYCVKRAAQIMGLGAEGIGLVPVDERFKMRAEALPEVLARAEARGRKVFAVSASACSTATGAFDPLEEVAAFCESRGLWLHVDGAHGAAASVSPKYRHLVKGAERADSVVWDTHKMLLMPALATAVLFREGRPSYQAFVQQASYLFTAEAGTAPEADWFNVGQRTLECTKHMMSLQLYAALAVQGTKMLADYVTGAFDLGARFGEMVEAAEDFELAVKPECNIVCFRYVPGEMGLDRGGLDRLNGVIRQRVLASGDFYLVQTQLPTGLYLRVTLINPLTKERDCEELLGAVRAAGREMLRV